jgi:hypothetical protein
VDRNAARKLLSEWLQSGRVSFTGHATRELDEDDLTMVDADNVLRCGRILDEGEFENGELRFRVQTAHILLVITFIEETKTIRVITGMRKKRK